MFENGLFVCALDTNGNVWCVEIAFAVTPQIQLLKNSNVSGIYSNIIIYHIFKFH